MTSQAISNTGDWLIIGILVGVVGKIAGPAGSAIAISGLWIAKMLPIIISPVIGILVDTVDRKKGMIISDISRGFLIALIPLVMRFNSLFLIYAIIFISEAFTLFFVPAKDASIPDIVKHSEILDANSLSFSINQITMFIGLALGTIIVLTVNKIFLSIVKIANNAALTLLLKNYGGPYAAILVDAFSFFVSAFLLYKIVFPKSDVKPAAHYKAFYHEIAESFRYLSTNKKIRGLIISAGFGIFGLGTILIIGPDYANKVLGMGSNGFLPLLTILSLGLLTGAVSTGMVTKRFSKEAIFTASLLGLGLCLIIFSFIPIYFLAISLSFVAGFLLGLLYVSAYTIMHENLSEKIRGRILTTLEADIRLAIIVSAAITGPAAYFVGALHFGGINFALLSSRIVLFSGGLIVTFAALYAYNFVYRSLHHNHEKPQTTS